MEIIQNPAQSLTANFEESFDEFGKRIRKSTKRDLRYGNGKKVAITPELFRCFIEMDLTRLASDEEFSNLTTAIMATVKQFEEKKLLPVDWVKRIGTPINVPPLPAIPQHIVDEVESGGGEVKIYLDGTTFFDIVAEYPEVIYDNEVVQE